jgi:3-oxo-5alpha-steroid 4-dehydrogenase
MSTAIPELAPMPESWDDEVDVVVVGLGGAGSCAALEAAEQGARVIVLERFHGGGSTAVSGGIVYAGGGTSIQREAGFDDAPEQMFRYLQHEVKGAVSDETLRHFCECSAPGLGWLAGHGVPFDASYCPFKTSYPTDDYYLYYSGNESARPYRDDAEPAPRGHRAHGKGLSGGVLMASLIGAVEANDAIDVRTQARVTALIADDDGVIVGVEYSTFPEGSRDQAKHRRASKLSSKWSNYSPMMRRRTRGSVKKLEAKATVVRRVRATGGVIVGAGGLIRNREMVDSHAPDLPKLLALGSMGDDGAGIRLGQGAGGSVGYMERVSVWRFFNPPVAFVKGVLVDSEGSRICNEELYGASVGRQIVARGNKAWLIVDSATRAEVKKRMTAETIMFQRLTSLYLLTLGKDKAATIEALAEKLGMSELVATIATYNAGAEAGEDAFGKSEKVLQTVSDGPFYAMNVSVGRNPYYPTPSLTLGGLQVDEVTGGVRREDGSTITGLYAAGRSAVGVCSEGYVSGLAIADAVYSGRRAGHQAAGGTWRQSVKNTQPPHISSS